MNVKRNVKTDKYGCFYDKILPRVKCVCINIAKCARCGMELVKNVYVVKPEPQLMKINCNIGYIEHFAMLKDLKNQVRESES